MSTFRNHADLGHRILIVATIAHIVNAHIAISRLEPIDDATPPLLTATRLPCRPGRGARMARAGGTSIAVAIVLAMACAPSVRAETLGSELTRFLHDDAVATVHLRSFFLDRTDPRPPNNRAWAGGGWLGYESGWLFDTLQVGAVGYTTQPLWAPAGMGGTLALKHDQSGFWTLGQAYASVKV